jgi:hypothetical protein
MRNLWQVIVVCAHTAGEAPPVAPGGAVLLWAIRTVREILDRCPDAA